jgi:hypothetical protein
MTQNKIYSFRTGVKIEINDTSITTIDNKGSSYIILNKLDNLTYSNIVLPRISPVTLLFRTVGLSILIAFAIGIVFDRIEGGTLKGFGLLGILFILNILFFFLFVFDTLFQFNIFNRIINNFFSNKLIHVTIGNKSGNNIEFYTLPEELIDIMKLKKNIETFILGENERMKDDKYADDLKSNVDELRKLNELFKTGVITDEEFKQLKSRIISKS